MAERVVERRSFAVVRHPSGRPLHRHSTVGRTIWRIPDEGPVTPRLRVPRRDLSMTRAHIGFLGPQFDYEGDERE